ncbi:Copper transporter 6, partial [Linum grandiflorum]
HKINGPESSTALLKAEKKDIRPQRILTNLTNTNQRQEMDHGGMSGMDQGGMPGMGGGGPPMSGNATHPMKMMAMHMTFYWGRSAEVLFAGWPGSSGGMYALALIFVFALGFLVEWLSHSRFMNPNHSGNTAAGLVQTAVHSVRVGLSYLAMLAVMSFNGGVFLAAIGGHTLGFFLFGSNVFKKSDEASDFGGKPSSDDHIPLHQ